MIEVAEAVLAYIAALAGEQRRMFERLHALILRAYPEAVAVLSYRMPTYKVGSRRLHVGAWSHGLSVYGWRPEPGMAFVSRHPGLTTSKGTIRLSPDDAAVLSDEDLLELVGAALDP